MRSKRNRRKKARYKNSRTQMPPKVTKFQAVSQKTNKLILWLAATGVLGLAAGQIYADINLNYVEPAGRGYVFKLTNNTIFDREVEFFKVSPDVTQQFLYKITKDVYATETENGVVLPGGNVSWVPSHEYHGLDGKKLEAFSSVQFRIPPIDSRSYVVPEAVMMFAHYHLTYENPVMSKIQQFMEYMGMLPTEQKVRYLVSEEYWTPVGSKNTETAIQSACTEDDVFAKSTICNDSRN